MQQSAGAGEKEVECGRIAKKDILFNSGCDALDILLILRSFSFGAAGMVRFLVGLQRASVAVLMRMQYKCSVKG